MQSNLTRLRMPLGSRIARFAVIAGAMIVSSPAFAGLVINPTFTANFNTNFGANAAAAQASWNAAAAVFMTNFTDNVTINITVDGVAGTSVFGQSSSTGFLTTYANARNLLITDAKTADDATSIGAGGSLTAADPTAGGNSIYVSRGQAKAIGLIASDGTTDGTTTFGAGNPFTFSGAIAGGTYDFQGVAAHEIAEVMGRIGFKSTTTDTILDLFSYTGAGARSLINGDGASLSIDNGTTLLKAFNANTTNGLDSRDWAPATNDAMNQFSNSGVVNAVSVTDLRELDVIGYDRSVGTTGTPEPSTGILLVSALVAGGFIRRRVKA